MQIGGTFGYEGTWVSNMRQGFGREVRPDGGEYTGEWREDQRAGTGILRMSNGAFHNGHWEHNSPVGDGTRVSSEGIEFVGAWDGDFLANGHLELRGGEHYDGKLYDSKRKTVDPAFLSWLERVAGQGNLGAALLLGQAYRFFLESGARSGASHPLVRSCGRRRARQRRSTSSPRSCSRNRRHGSAAWNC